MHALRFPFAAGSGLLVTLAVFSLLWTFVSRPIDVKPALKVERVDFKRQRVDTPVEPRRNDKVVRKPPPVVPTDLPLGQPNPHEVTPVRYDPVGVSVDVGRGGGLPIGQDRDVTPIVRVPPEYPAREAAKGIEGRVKVQFSITAIGTVRDAIVVDADPKGSFEDSALKAIARWRYNPKIESGVAVERVGLQTIIRFQLEQQ